MAVDNFRCNKEDEENLPFIDEDEDTDEEDDNVNDEEDVEKDYLLVPSTLTCKRLRKINCECRIVWF